MSNEQRDAAWRRRGAVVLCGGQSSRMGQDKAWLPIGDEAMLTRVVRIVGAATPASNIVVVAGVDQHLPLLPAAVRVIRDAEAFRGPLPALIAGLTALADTTDAAFVTSCDAPLLHAPVIDWFFWYFNHVRRRAAAGDLPIEAVVPRGQWSYPLTAVYGVSARQGFSASLARGERSLQSVIAAGLVKTHHLPLDDLKSVDPRLDLLLNCNTPEDYQSALARLLD